MRSIGRAAYSSRMRERDTTSIVASGLVARGRELAEIDQLLRCARRGRAGAAAFHGESGVGKSALLEAAVARAVDFRTIRIRGSALSGTVGAPGGLVSAWPEPLHELAATLGPVTCERPSFVGSARPSSPAVSPALLDTAATSLRRLLGPAPLLIALDDSHVLPRALITALASAVVGPLRREPVVLVVAWRDTPHLQPCQMELGDVSVHQLDGLNLFQSRELLTMTCDHLPSEPVHAVLVARTGGNPLALLDACSRLSAAQLAGWHPLPDPLPMGAVSIDAFDVGRYLPPATRRALAVVAAGSAPSSAVAQAMDRLGISERDLTPALEAGVLYRRGSRTGFHHSLVRSAAFLQAPVEERREIRRVLSDVLAEAHAIEHSAYHASVDVTGADEMAVRRLAEAASVALERGEPAAAATYEELAASCAATHDEKVLHLAAAAGHWAASGETARARQCLANGTDAVVNAAVKAEVTYQRARLACGTTGATLPEEIVAAARACAGDRPSRALAMLLDAAAWRLLADEPVEAERAAERGVRLAAAVSSHWELLARMVYGAAVLACGKPVDGLSDRSRTPLLVGDSERFPCSPEVACVIGSSLLHQGLRRQAERWSRWIARCALRSGDVSLAAVPPLLDCAIGLASGDVVAAGDALKSSPVAPGTSGTVLLRARAWQLAAVVHAIAGECEAGFDAGLRLFSMPDDVAGGARLRALPSLAFLELQRGRLDAAVAWARIARNDAAGGAGPVSPAIFAVVAPLTASVLLLAGSPAEPPFCASLSPEGGLYEALPEWCSAWLEGVCQTDDPMGAADLLHAAAAELEDRPLLQMVVELSRAVRLTDAGLADAASQQLSAVERRALACGAGGLAKVAARQRERIVERCAFVGSRVTAPSRGTSVPSRPEDPAHQREGRGEAPAVPEWEIVVLGGFSVRRRGKPLSLPVSLASQAIKIVALQPRITVDELIELLWEEAEPRIGNRRLRNVLWRIRSTCGDLLVREDGFLRLAPGATTDLGRFRALAEQALVGTDAGTPAAVELARSALDLYRGEVLPGDRYADWSTAARESATRTYLRLLDLLVDDALAGDREAEALVLLDRLAEVDPYEERHHLRTAKIHRDAGNRGRALDAIEHAERMLADLGVAPSSAVRLLRAELGGSKLEA